MDFNRIRWDRVPISGVVNADDFGLVLKIADITIKGVGKNGVQLETGDLVWMIHEDEVTPVDVEYSIRGIKP